MFRDIKTTWVDPHVLYISALLTPPPVDVDYIDISDTPITDPARLLSQESVHPFWVEDRRRKAQHEAIAEFSIALETMLRDFYRNKLILARGVNRCAYRWEVEYSEKLLDSFLEFEETVLDALYEFFAIADKYSGCLWEAFGFNDEEFAQMEKLEREKDRLSSLQSEFHHAVYCLLHKSEDPDGDLPF